MNAGTALPSSVNKLRFCWWAAEEWGLYGSEHYVNMLNATERSKIAAYLNFDMQGSRNYISFVFNGTTAPDAVRVPSETLTGLFLDEFSAQQRPFESEAFAGSVESANTDYGPFLFGGIPSGGQSTGASEMKRIEERSSFGGFANTPADSCYHRKCDTVENIDFDELERGSRRAAGVLTKLANQQNLKAFLQAGPATQTKNRRYDSMVVGAEEGDRQMCQPSMAEPELVCSAAPRQRVPKWALHRQ